MGLTMQFKPFPAKCSLIAMGKDAFEMIYYMAQVAAHLYRRSKMAQTKGKGGV